MSARLLSSSSFVPFSCSMFPRFSENEHERQLEFSNTLWLPRGSFALDQLSSETHIFASLLRARITEVLAALRGQRFDLFHHVRILARHIDRFAQVGFQIEQLSRDSVRHVLARFSLSAGRTWGHVIVWKMQLPRAAAHRLEFLAPVKVISFMRRLRA